MNTFMKLFAIFVVFIQIQTALSHPIQSPSEPKLISQLCKRNHYPTLCISTLNLDPRSEASNLHGLAAISIHATKKKMKESLEYLFSLYKDIRRQDDFKKYGICIEEHDTAVDKNLPAALAALKAKKYFQAMTYVEIAGLAPYACAEQFDGKSPLALTERNKAVHDITLMTADIIKTFVIHTKI